MRGGTRERRGVQVEPEVRAGPVGRPGAGPSRRSSTGCARSRGPPPRRPPRVRGRRTRSTMDPIRSARRPHQPLAASPVDTGRSAGTARGTRRTARRTGRGPPDPARGAARPTSSPATPSSSDANAPTPTAARIAAPRTAVSPTAGIATGTPRTSALIRAQVSPGRRPAGQAQLAHRRTGRRERLRDVPHRERRALQDRAGEVLRPVGQRQPEETPRGRLVEDRCALPRQVRQEHEPIGTRRDAARPRRTARRATSGRRAPALRSQSTDAPSAAIAPPTTQRPGSGAGARNAPSHVDRAVGVDADAAGRPARVHGVARRAQPGAQHATPSRR